MSVLKLLLVIAAAGCAAANSARSEEHRSAQEKVGPETEAVDTTRYERIIHVRAAPQAGVEDGSPEAPYRSIGEALRQAAGASQDRPIAVFVAAGDYPVRSLALRRWVDLYGGFEPAQWRREVSQHQTILNGEGNRAVVIGAENARIDGFVITGGKSDGFGGGILCAGCSPTISNNWIVLNRSVYDRAQIDATVLHQQGTGGGGICCLGASPLIRNNWIAQNRTDFGNGGGVFCSNHSHPRIERNLFSANESGVHDPETRSSNGGAIACSHFSSPVILGNVMLNNHAGGRGDGGGVYGEYSSQPQIEENIFLGNSAEDDGAAAYFMAAARPLFRNNLLVGNGSGQGVIRLSKNGLGHFEANKIFGNPTSGILCRAAAAVTVNNLICENAGSGIVARGSVLTSRNDTICRQAGFGIEVKHGSARMVNSLIVANAAGQVRLDTNELSVRHSLLAGKTDDEPAGRAALETTAQSNLERILVYAARPRFRDDARTAAARNVRYDPQRLTTAAELADALPTDQTLAYRPVRIGKTWTVCRAVEGRRLSVWGDLRGEFEPTETTSCYFPQTYHLASGSAGIDRGDLLGSPATDFEGQPRPHNARTSDQVDIGADEYTEPLQRSSSPSTN